MTAGSVAGSLVVVLEYRSQLWRPRVVRRRHVATWAALALSVATYAAVSAAMHQPFRLGGLRLRYFDLRIYRLAALRLAHGTPLYAGPMLHHLGFTYPPFAALLLAPLAWVSLPVDTLAVTGLNILLLVWIMRRTLMLTSAQDPSRRPARAVAWSQAAGLAAAALWLEPVSVALGYGQIDLLITALVVFDLSLADDARGKGAATGVAAALKLTPLLFIVYLALSRRRRAAAIAALTFVASIALSFTLLARDAAAYWFHAVLETSRIGSPAAPIDQSLLGAIARFTGALHPAGGWALVIVAITGCGLALAIRAGRRGDEAAGFSLTALSALLASPISWPHHWTLAVPALVLLCRRALERRSRAVGAGAALLALVGCAYLPEVGESHFQGSRGLTSLLTTDPYPIVAVLVVTICAAGVARGRLRRHGLPSVRPVVSPAVAVVSPAVAVVAGRVGE